MSVEAGNPYLDFGPDNAEKVADRLRGEMTEHGLSPDDLKDAVVIGSGLGGFTQDVLRADKAGNVSGPIVLPFDEVFKELEIAPTDSDIARALIKQRQKVKADDTGHAKRLVIGHLNDGSGPLVIAQDGREHLYEDVHARRATFWLRVMQHLGVKSVIGTNAAGIVTPDLLKPRHDLMLVRTHIDETGQSALTGPNFPEWGERFPHRGFEYPQAIREIVRKVALAQGIDRRVKEGVYFRRTGPKYESPAEVLEMRAALMRLLEQDALLPEGMRLFSRRKGLYLPGVVGMSSAYEAEVIEHTRQSETLPAFADGYAYLSVPTNYSAAMGPEAFAEPEKHDDVKKAVKEVEAVVQELVSGVILEINALR